MKTLCIGILAYNEEDSIENTIRSVFEQSILHAKNQHDEGFAIELVVVPNGCKDRTAELASKAMTKELADKEINPNLTAKACELAEPGKENAWNHYIHEFSSPDSDFYILIDADIRLEHPEVLYNLVDCLISNPQADVSSGSPIKHIQQKPRKSILDHLSIGATRLRWGMKGTLAGCLYCGRGEVLRSFRLPTVLMGEDSFIRAMIVTKGFTQKDDPSLIVNARNATVVFEAYTSPSEIIRNKTRRMFESTINAILYTKLWADSTPQTPAGDLIKLWDAHDSSWSHTLINEEFELRGFWKIPKFFMYKQFLQLRHHRWPKRLRLLPVALATLPLNTLAVYRANKIADRGDIRKLWDKASS